MVQRNPMGAHDRIKLYVVFWFLIAVVFVIFFSFSSVNKEVIECLDGTLTYDAAECPQCLSDDHCDLDSYCRFDVCAASQCVTDEECQMPGNECIFGFCRNIGGGSITDFADDDV